MRQELAVLVETYLNSQNWKFGYNADRGLFTLNMSTKNFTGARVVVQINDDSIIAYAIAPIMCRRKSGRLPVSLSPAPTMV